MSEVVIMFAIFVLLLFIKVPIVFALIISVVTTFAISGIALLEQPAYLAHVVFNTLDMFTILAVPLFLLVGYLTRFTVAQKIIDFVNIFFYWMKGRLSFVAVAGCMFFGAIVGSVMATIGGVGGVMIPVMEKEGFKRVEATALVTASSIAGILIPPSISSILIALIAGISVAAVFLTSVGPAFLLCAGFFVISYFKNERFVTAKKINDIIPKGDNKLKYMRKSFSNALPALLLPFFVLGGIYGGVFTPTEAAAVSVTYLIIYLLIIRQLNMKRYASGLLFVGITNGVVLLLFGLSAPLGRVISVYNVTKLMGNLILTITDQTIPIVLLVLLFIIILGMFLETGAIIILAIPVFYPFLLEVGISPYHFAGMFEVCIAIGMLTPPVGYGIFMGMKTGNVDLYALTKALLPYYIWCIIALIIIVLIPGISEWLPKTILD